MVAGLDAVVAGTGFDNPVRPGPDLALNDVKAAKGTAEELPWNLKRTAVPKHPFPSEAAKHEKAATRCGLFWLSR
jgi:hypothetical protein